MPQGPRADMILTYFHARIHYNVMWWLRLRCWLVIGDDFLAVADCLPRLSTNRGAWQHVYSAGLRRRSPSQQVGVEALRFQTFF